MILAELLENLYGNIKTKFKGHLL